MFNIISTTGENGGNGKLKVQRDSQLFSDFAFFIFITMYVSMGPQSKRNHKKFLRIWD